MSITTELHWHGATGRATATEVEYTAVYRVRTDSYTVGPSAIFAHFRDPENSLPWFGSTYSYGGDSDSSAVCTEVSTPRHVSGSAEVWEITLTFSTQQGASGQNVDTEGNPTNYPLDYRPQVWMSGSLATQPIDSAIYRGGFLHDPQLFLLGTKYRVQNSSGEQIDDPPLEEDVAIGSVFVKTFEQVYDIALHQRLTHVNNGPVAFKSFLPYRGSFAARTLKIVAVQVMPKRESVEHNDARSMLDYVEITHELAYNPRGWRKKIADIGFHRGAMAGDPDGKGGTISFTDLIDGVAPVMPIVGPIDGRPVRRPVLLNGAGQPAADTRGNAVMIEWQTNDEVTFYAHPSLGLALEAG